MPDASLTCIDLWCKGGSYFEKEGEEGLAHFLEHMIFKGSNLLKEGEFDKKIEAFGGSSNAATGHDDVHYYVLVPNKAVSNAIDLLLNLALAPSLEEKPYLLNKFAKKGIKRIKERYNWKRIIDLYSNVFNELIK